MSKSLSNKELKSPHFGKENKPLRSPSSIFSDFFHHFTLLSKKKDFDPYRYPFIYHFFSYRDFAFWISRTHSGSYQLRGYFPSDFNVSDYSDNACFLEIHTLYNVLYDNPDLSLVSKQFDKVVHSAFNFIYFHSSSYERFFDL